MKDAKGHGSEARGGAADQPTHTRPPAVHSFKKSKRSQTAHGGGDGRGGGGSSGGGQGGGHGGGSMQKHKTGAHTAGIHKALKMNLAQLSAAGTNPNIPPPQIGGRK